MSETNHEIDSNFADPFNILRAGVLGANDGIYFHCWCGYPGLLVLTSNIWIDFLSGFAAIWCLSMAEGGDMCPFQLKRY